MATFWHIAGKGYEAGADLLSFSELYDRGIVTESDWRWDHSFEAWLNKDGTMRRRADDSRFVSLWGNAARALEWLEAGDAPEGYKVLAVDVDDDMVFTAPEGHPAVDDLIPGCCVREASLAELEHAAKQGNE